MCVLELNVLIWGRHMDKCVNNSYVLFVLVLHACCQHKISSLECARNNEVFITYTFRGCNKLRVVPFACQYHPYFNSEIQMTQNSVRGETQSVTSHKKSSSDTGIIDVVLVLFQT